MTVVTSKLGIRIDLDKETKLKHDGSNFRDWKARIGRIFSRLGMPKNLLDLLHKADDEAVEIISAKVVVKKEPGSQSSRDKEAPEEAKARALDSLSENDKICAFTVITETIDEVLAGVTQYVDDDLEEVWDIIQRTVFKVNILATGKKFKNAVNLKMGDEESVAEFTSKLEAMIKELESLPTSMAIGTELKIYVLLAGVINCSRHEDFESTISHLLGEKKLSFKKVRDRLVAAEEQHGDIHRPEVVSGMLAQAREGQTYITTKLTRKQAQDIDCNNWTQKGVCDFRDNCYFKHDPAKKGVDDGKHNTDDGLGRGKRKGMPTKCWHCEGDHLKRYCPKLAQDKDQDEDGQVAEELIDEQDFDLALVAEDLGLDDVRDLAPEFCEAFSAGCDFKNNI